MNFTPDTDQQLLQDSVRRFVEKDHGFLARAGRAAAGQAGSTPYWRFFADQGWLAVGLPQAHGGLGGSVLDTALIAQEFGRGMVIEPWLGCAVLAAQTLVAVTQATTSVRSAPSGVSATSAQLATLLPELADGSRRVALAYSEPGSRGDPATVTAAAVRTGEGYRLHGTKTLVLGAVGAAALVVSARIDDAGACVGACVGTGTGASAGACAGADVDADGITLFLVDAGSPGVEVQPLPLHDGRWAAEVRFHDVHVTWAAVLGTPGNGLPALRHGLAHATAALCAELVGAMEKAIELTAEYLKTRRQFGVPIGSFQVLQHRLADMAADLEVARSMLYVLLASIQQDPPCARDLTVSQAKALVGRYARNVCAQAIQLHGGIGMTEECPVGHYFRYAVVGDILLGSGAWHEAACAGVSVA